MQFIDFSQLSPTDVEQHFLDCCQSRRWAQMMARVIPVHDINVLLNAAKRIWEQLPEKDHLEAFGGHSKIGDIHALRAKYAVMTRNEQGQVALADQFVLEKLKELNERYEQRFGFIFIVSATGKSAEEMLSLLETRINNSREEELKLGAIEQSKITELRLKRLFDG